MRVWIVVVLVWAFLAVNVWAASPMVEAFKEYQSALDAGDIPKADAAGERAWQLAEQAGETETAAVLAYNLAELRLRYLPKKDALKPVKRAMELIAADPNESLSFESVGLLHAVIRQLKKPSKQGAKNLEEALKVFEQSGAEIAYPVFRGDLSLLDWAVSTGNWADALAYSKLAQEDIEILQIKARGTMAFLKLTGIAASFVLKRQKEKSDFGEFNANRYGRFTRIRPYRMNMADLDIEFTELFNLLGIQENGEFNPLYLQALAWRDALNALEASKHPKNPSFLGRLSIFRETYPTSCPTPKWESRRKPKYPYSAGDFGYAGAAVLVYSVSKDGVPFNINIGAEVPAYRFGKYSARAVKKWKAKPRPNLSAECEAMQYRTRFTFQMLGN